MARSRWQEIVTEELRKDRNGAFARAKARYHGGGAPMESNPSGGKLLKYALIAGAAYFGYHYIKAHEAPAALPVQHPQGTTNGTARPQSTTAI